MRGCGLRGASVIVCSIDLMNGRAVQLQRGERFVLEREDVVELAERFGQLGEVAVIDLDAALGHGSNRELIERLCRIAPCRVGGGIREPEDALRYLRAGAARVIIGTAANESLLTRLPKERTIVAIDARGDRVTTNGWTSVEDETPVQRAQRLAQYCGGFLFTDVMREGMMEGFDMNRVRELRDAVRGSLTVAGGITTAEEVASLDRLGVDAQVGMAVYTGRLDPAAAFLATLDFDKGGGLIPTIVCDATDERVRMLAYSTRESLAVALREGRGAYWSRSRQEIWRKGERSGATQRLRRVSVDCDRDALVFFVDQSLATCHTGDATCFNGAHFRWSDLLARIDDRIASGSVLSYTRRVAGDSNLLNAKLREEVEEVIQAPTAENLAWECADLLYFLSVKMRAAGLRIDDVMAQLAARAV